MGRVIRHKETGRYLQPPKQLGLIVHWGWGKKETAHVFRHANAARFRLGSLTPMSTFRWSDYAFEEADADQQKPS